MDIKEAFWSNVFWHIENKGLNAQKIIGSNYILAKRGELNMTFDTAQKIACKLGITDYTILFEGEWKHE